MDVMIWVLMGLIVMPLVIGFFKCDEVTIALEINKMNSPFYKIGVFSERYHLPDNQTEDELVIGLFFLNIVFVFWRANEEEDFNA